MQLLYNVIKKTYVNSESVYTVKAPVIPAKVEQKKEAEPVINLEEIKAYADSLISDAQQKCQMMTDSARQEAERIKKDAYDTAFNKGYSEGLKKGKEDGLKSTVDMRKSAEDVLKEAHKASREYIDLRRDEIVNLALYIAEKVIRYQVDVNDSIVIKMAKDSIDAAVVKEQVIIRVNPMDYANADCRLEEISKSAGENIKISLIRDGDIQRGGCRIETESSSVDATIDGQFERIKEALLG